MKDITSRKWFESIAYISLETGDIFIRERKDFLKQFVTLKEWRIMIEDNRIMIEDNREGIPESSILKEDVRSYKYV